MKAILEYLFWIFVVLWLIYVGSQATDFGKPQPQTQVLRRA